MGRRPNKILRKAAASKGMSLAMTRERLRISRIDPVARQEADRLGFVRHKDRLQIAQGRTLEEQLSQIQYLTLRRETPDDRDYRSLERAWKRASDSTRRRFVEKYDSAITAALPDHSEPD